MEQQDDKNADTQPLTDAQIEEKMREDIIGPCIKFLTAENSRLVATMELIDDAILFGGIDDYMTVGTTINILTDAREVEKLIGCNPKSKFHKNRPLVHLFVESLLDFRDEKRLITNQDTLVKAFNAMTAQRRQNLLFVGQDPNK